MGARGLTDQECIANAQRTKEHDDMLRLIKKVVKLCDINRNSITSINEMLLTIANEITKLKGDIKCSKPQS